MQRRKDQAAVAWVAASAVVLSVAVCLSPWVPWPAPPGLVLQQELPASSERGVEAATVCHLLGTSYLLQQEHGSAERAYLAALQLDPRRRDTLVALHLLQRIRGNEEAVRRSLRRLKDAKPGPPAIRDLPRTPRERPELWLRQGGPACRACISFTSGACIVECGID